MKFNIALDLNELVSKMTDLSEKIAQTTFETLSDRYPVDSWVRYTETDSNLRVKLGQQKTVITFPTI